MKKLGALEISLLLLHLVIVAGLFASRYSFEEDWQLTQRMEQDLEGSEVEGGGIHVSPWVAIRHYFSQAGDEAHYYEIATLMMGRSVEPSYYGHLSRRGGKQLDANLINNDRSQIPYRDFLFEYPPLMLVPIVLPALFVDTSLGYVRGFALLVAITVTASLILVLRFPMREKLSHLRILSLSAVTTFLFGIILATRLDIFPAFFTLLTLYLYVSNRYRWASVILAIAVMFKAYPLVLGPIFFMDLLFQKRWKVMWKAGGVFIVTLIGINLPFLMLAPQNYLMSFGYHADRGVQLESLYASYALLRHLVSDFPVQIFFGFGSTDLWFEQCLAFKKWASSLGLITFFTIYARFTWLRRNQRHRDALLIHTVLLLTLAFIITFKVLSAQFIIWIFPLIFLVREKISFWPIFLYMSIVALTHLLYPIMLSSLFQLREPTVILVIFRNFLLLVLFCVLFLQNETKET